MAAPALPDVPSDSFIFIDANIFVYELIGQSGQCRQFLDRCGSKEVTGIALFETVNEVTHRLMLAEALSKGFVTRATASRLRENSEISPRLADYWRNIERLLALNLLFVPVDEQVLRAAHAERQTARLLTNDSMIASCMREYGVSLLATNAADFERALDITVFKPTDLL